MPLTANDLAGAWNLDAGLFVGLSVVAWLYMRGLGRLWRSAGRGQVVSRGRATAFAASVAVTAVALVSPLDALSEALFSAHMAQHLLLVLVAVPLGVLGMPGPVLARALPAAGRRRAGRWQGRLARVVRETPGLPVASLAVFAGTLWAWHVPVLYDLAIRNRLMHDLEHLTLLGSAALFWWPVLRPRRTPSWAGLLLLFCAALQSGILAALLTFSPRAWYEVHAATTAAWGLTPVEDQQLAGVLMWVPGGIVYLLAAAVTFIRWLDEDERRAERAAGPPRAQRAAGAAPAARASEGVHHAP